MKKLLLLLFSILISFNSYADEEDSRVNLICTNYETYHWKDGKTTELKPEEESLIIFPESKRYLYKSHDSYYTSEGNNIFFEGASDSRKVWGMKFKYSLDRTTGAFDEDYYVKNEFSDYKYELLLTFKAKCKKTENLF